MVDDEEIEDFLAHYGVKGMKWGVRRERRRERRIKKQEAYERREAKTNRAGKLTGRQRVGAVGVGYLSGNVAATLGIIASGGNVQVGQALALPSAVAGGLFMRKAMLNQGKKRMSEISGKTDKKEEDKTLKEVEEFLKKSNNK